MRAILTQPSDGGGEANSANRAIGTLGFRMRSPKNFRVIKGDKGGGTGPDAPAALDVAELRERVLQLRYLLTLCANENAIGLAVDMEEAIGALGRLQLSDHPDARRRIAEYRTLIAEIDLEILAVLRGA